MTEHDAWKMLADLWGSLADDPTQSFAGALARGDRSGLCCCLEKMCAADWITDAVWDSMHGQIMQEKVRLGNISLYVWPQGHEGAAGRAAFCARMAAETAPNKENVDGGAAGPEGQPNASIMGLGDRGHAPEGPGRQE
jgi:hypothetical protein